MRYHIFNIGKPYTDEWWARLRSMGVITAGFKGRRGDRGDVILHDIDRGDWVIGYANRHGVVGAGLMAGPDTYRLLTPAEFPPGYEATHEHLRSVAWIHCVERLADALSLDEVQRHPPRQTKEALTEETGLRIIQLLAAQTAHTQVRLPEEIISTQGLMEGSVQQILVDRYERNAEARRQCLEHWGLDCSVCGFRFSLRYGALGAGYIHVHHLRPIASTEGEYIVDPIRDLCPVCPNCHAMLHRSDPPLEIAVLKGLLAVTA